MYYRCQSIVSLTNFFSSREKMQVDQKIPHLPDYVGIHDLFSLIINENDLALKYTRATM